METRQHDVFQNNQVPIQLIANGIDIWDPKTSHYELLQFKQLYLLNYSALPTNQQFTERGVKESGYVTLGRRGESQRSMIAIARAKLVPDAYKKGRAQIQTEGVDDKKKQLQGKTKTRFLLKEKLEHCKKVELVKRKRHDNGVVETRELKKMLTCPNLQFKKVRIDEKLNRTRSRMNNDRPLNALQQRSGHTLTPLMEGKIQYYFLTAKDNIAQIRAELEARGLSDKFDEKTKWKHLLLILKEDEKDNRYFYPRTDYNLFVIRSKTSSN